MWISHTRLIEHCRVLKEPSFLVDATQGIQAQTIANAYKAIEKNLTIIPVINKVDLPHADVEKTRRQLVDFLGIQESEIHEISAKSGLGVSKLLNDIIEKVPEPSFNSTNTELQSLIFDSYYDSHKGVIAFVRVFDGAVKKRDKVRLIAHKSVFEVSEVGIFHPELDSNRFFTKRGNRICSDKP